MFVATSFALLPWQNTVSEPASYRLERSASCVMWQQTITIHDGQYETEVRLLYRQEQLHRETRQLQRMLQAEN